MINRKKSSGFTLLELIVVIAIIAILGYIAIGSFDMGGLDLREEAWNLRRNLVKVSNQAITTNTIHTVTFTATGYSDDQGVVSATLESGVTLTTTYTGDQLSFNGMGNAQTGSVTLTDGEQTYTVRTNRAGRIWIE